MTEKKNCINFKTRKLARLLSRHYDIELSKAGLKTTQFSLLTHLVRLSPITAGSLARQMGLDASTLTRNLQPLISAGWVTLETGTDARYRHIAITPEGIARQSEADRHWLIAQTTMSERLGSERSAQLSLVLDGCISLLAGDSA